MAMKTHATEWKTYEDVARHLLHVFRDAFNLAEVEGKQPVAGKSGTTWEIDAKGVSADGSAFVLIECRCLASRVKQEAMAAIAFRITDTGASRGILVSPLPPQEGAAKVAQSANVVTVTLDPRSTPEDFVIGFLDKLVVGVTDRIAVQDHLTITCIDKDGERILHSDPEG